MPSLGTSVPTPLNKLRECRVPRGEVVNKLESSRAVGRNPDNLYVLTIGIDVSIVLKFIVVAVGFNNGYKQLCLPLSNNPVRQVTACGFKLSVS